MHANVTGTVIHESARASVAKASSAAVAHNTIPAQGLVTFASMKSRRSKVSVRASNKTRGQVWANKSHAKAVQPQQPRDHWHPNSSGVITI
jgi:hypothetical protein